MYMSHGVNEKAPKTVPPPLPLTAFSPGLFALLQEILYQSFFCWSILLFCVYVFLRALFHGSAIMKLRIASCLHICIASYLASHQIMWHNKRNLRSWLEN